MQTLTSTIDTGSYTSGSGSDVDLKQFTLLPNKIYFLIFNVQLPKSSIVAHHIYFDGLSAAGRTTIRGDGNQWWGPFGSVYTLVSTKGNTENISFRVKDWSNSSQSCTWGSNLISIDLT